MPTARRYITIHGHFYQPPRENPWLETVETQDSASPYHDWNERICTECYATNGAARIVNEQRQITRITNNYSHISFNFGPTLLSWLEEQAPRTYRTILEGERSSRKNFGGHSSAMAQVYNHIIMPLANRRDRLTQIRWGIADYTHRYGLAPEGIWLAETAVDTETLELLADHGIRFTLLAPHQCKRIRSLKTTDDKAADWTDTPNATVDTTRPYLVKFASGKSIAVFFYDGPASRAIAFEGLLNSGENFAARLKSALHQTDKPQLASVATDGESYGHHHRHGEMALAYALLLLEEDTSVRLTNYAQFLAKFPPDQEAEVIDNTSWSCAHGIERWRSDCGCNSHPGWHQQWRAPLRQALDTLRDAVTPLTEQLGATLFRDVWAARDAYIDVILDRSGENTARFFNAQQSHALSEEERITALELLELQRHTQLMYTSCGWFFDDISGIEATQVLAYAGRVLQLSRDLFGESAASLEPAFLATLAQAPSNIPEQENGAIVYNGKIRHLMLGLEEVAAHYAISSVFSSYSDETEIFFYRVTRLSYEICTSGRGRVALGRARIHSTITGQVQCFSFAVVHFGDQNITAAVKPYIDADAPEFEAFVSEVRERVQAADFPAVIRQLDRYYGQVAYSLTSLFTDEQRRIVRLILDSTLLDIENSLTSIYEDHATLLHYLSQSNLPKPPALTLAAGFAINAGLRRAIESDSLDITLLRSLLSLAKSDQVTVDSPTLSYIADQRMKRTMVELYLSTNGADSSHLLFAALERALTLARALNELPFELNLWQAQNIWYEIMRTNPHEIIELTSEERLRWERDFKDLGCCLTIACDVITADDIIVGIPASAND